MQLRRYCDTLRRRFRRQYRGILTVNHFDAVFQGVVLSKNILRPISSSAIAGP